MFVKVEEVLTETEMAALSISEYIALWNKRVAIAVEEAKANGNAKAWGYFHDTYWLKRYEEYYSNALEWQIAMEYQYFSDDYKDRNGVRPRWVEMPKSLAEMRAIRKDYLG